MSELAVTKLGLLIFACFSIFLIVTFLRFPLHTNSYQGAGILIAAIVPALLLALPLWNKVTYESISSVSLFFSEKERALLPRPLSHLSLFTGMEDDDYKSREIEDSEVPEGYAKQYWTVFTDERGLDFAELLVVNAYVHEFLYSWAHEEQVISMASGVTRERRPPSINGTRDRGVEIRLRSFSNEFEHNALIRKSFAYTEIPYFHIPPKATITVPSSEQEDKTRQRTININVPGEGNLTIKISSAGGGPIGGIVTDPDIVEMAYKVTLELNFYKYTHVGGALEEWFGNMSDLYKQLSWQNRE